MLKDTVAVIDVGSSKISGIIGENGVNNNYVIRAHCEFPTFALGGAVGEIDAPEEFTKSIKNVLSSMENSARAKITKVYFGVPGDFLAIRNSSLQMYLNKPRKLKQKDVDEYLCPQENRSPSKGTSWSPKAAFPIGWTVSKGQPL